MSYGIPIQIDHDCGHPLIVVDFTKDPPPIPRHVEPAVTDDNADGQWLHRCPSCGEELDGWALLEKYDRMIAAGEGRA